MMEELEKLISLHGKEMYLQDSIKGLEESIKVVKIKLEEVRAIRKAKEMILKDKKIILTQNIILCGQDFRFYRGVPEDVEFTIEEINDGRLRIRGPKHGDPGNYGNGLIVISLSDLYTYWLKKQECP